MSGDHVDRLSLIPEEPGIGFEHAEPLVIQYLEHMLTHRNRAATTLNDYAHVLESWVAWPHGGILNATVADMEAWIARPRVRRGGGRLGAPATRKKEVAILRSFYGWCHANGLTPFNMTLNLHAPVVHNVLPKPVPPAAWIKVWRSELDSVDRVWLGLGYYVGLRRSELVVLRRDHFTADSIVGLVRKGGSEDTVPYADMLGVVQDKLPTLLPGGPQTLLRPLQGLVGAGGDSLLFPWLQEGAGDIDPQTINKRLARILRNLNAERFTPHQLRHSCATNMIQAGVPLPVVSRLLNHTSIETTMRYVKAGASELSEWRRANVSRKRGTKH